jgi:uncharacterized membrane protein YdjX (TVP38/TMEM64 family)
MHPSAKHEHTASPSREQEDRLLRRAERGLATKPKRHYLRSAAWLRCIFTLLVLYASGLSLIVTLFNRLPPVAELAEKTSARTSIKSVTTHAASLRLAVPHSVRELREVRVTLETYRDTYGTQVLALLASSYIFLQTFMIPGPLAINVLAGSLYPFGAAMVFTAVVSTIGASLNYWMVRLLLRDAVAAVFPARVAAFRAEVAAKAHLLNWMLFIRVTPVLPHWFVNLASPIVGVPFPVFLLATVVGHQPMNFITVQTGAALASIESFSDVYNSRNIAFLMLVGLVALLPIVIKRRATRQSAVSIGRKKLPLPMLPIINKAASDYAA